MSSPFCSLVSGLGFNSSFSKGDSANGEGKTTASIAPEDPAARSFFELLLFGAETNGAINCAEGTRPEPKDASIDTLVGPYPDGGFDGGQDGGQEIKRGVIPGINLDELLITGGMIVTDDQDGNIQIINNGHVFIKGNMIQCVGRPGNPCPGTENASVVQLALTDKVYPALIDAHNHPNYNICGPFTHAGKTYLNNSATAKDGGWRGATEYDNWTAQCYDVNNGLGLDCQMFQYGKIKALVGGAGTIQGISQSQGCLTKPGGPPTQPLLVRMLDSTTGLGKDLVRTQALGVRGRYTNADAQIVCDAVDANNVNRFFVHIGEGQRGNAYVEEEWSIISKLGVTPGCLLDPSLVMIHGNFVPATLTQAAAYGAKIIWSPTSNTDLYGWDQPASLSIPDALALKITVALGPDWTPGIGMITEINMARKYAQSFFPQGSVTDETLFKMATFNVAIAAGLNDYIGRISANMHADITVIRGKSNNPFEPAYLGEVALVMVDGNLYYMDKWASAATRLPPENCEPLTICNVEKKLCIPTPTKGQKVILSDLQNGTFFFAPNPKTPAVTVPYTPPAFDAQPEACGPN